MSVSIGEIIVEVLPDPEPAFGHGNCVPVSPVSKDEQAQIINKLMELNRERMARLAVD